ncbi:MAG: rRNA maturation RNase YbeY [Phycisphaerales bacterium]|nr:rRNA maturation RNase YbeY [Phycisphaerales bacterium]
MQTNPHNHNSPHDGADSPVDEPAGLDETEQPPPAGAEVRLGIHIIDALQGEPVADLDLGRLDIDVRRALDHLDLTAGEISVVLVDDATMRAEHLAYLSVDETTDVLTFDLRDEADGPLDVEIKVCVDEARRQSAELGHDATRELLLYIVHGLLHCLGFDDHDEQSFERMHRREDEILDAIGVGATFHRSERFHGGS